MEAEIISTINPDLAKITANGMHALLPYLILLGGATLSILLSIFRAIKPKYLVFFAALVTAGAFTTLSFQQIGYEKQYLFNSQMLIDGFSLFFNVLLGFSFVITALLSFRYLDREELQYPEYFIIGLFSLLGMSMMVASNNLLITFISLELMSLMIYTLVGFRRADRRCNEASLKYFVLGGVASVVFLYGASFIYGATNTLTISEILEFVTKGNGDSPALFYVGAWLVMAGFLFKIAAFPFHMWMPDVYEGAPTPITGLMATAVKAASFATLLRIFNGLGFTGEIAVVIQNNVYWILWTLALVTMVVGNFVALSQTNLKRMLAYSSIAHTGYLLVGIAGLTQQSSAFEAVSLYLASYVVMNLGAIGILTLLGTRGDGGLQLQDMAGVARRHPFLSLSMAVFLFSMAGIPPTAGAVGKFFLFLSAVRTGMPSLIFLVVLGVLCSIVSVYYYVRVLVYMYMREPVGSEPDLRVSIWAAAAIACTVLLTIQIGVLPGGLIRMARLAVESF